MPSSGPSPGSELRARLERIAAAEVLLVACDFDGTLAPIVEDPATARPLRAAAAALAALATLPRTHAALVSGRSRDDLAALVGSPSGVRLVGSHGGELEPGSLAERLSPEQRERLEGLQRELAAIAATAPGLIAESKPAGVALHYRMADPRDAQRAMAAVLAGPAAISGVHLRHGKKVVELSVVPDDKGGAVALLRERTGASAVLYLGDDVTDEDVFRTLGEADLGVKVGEGPTSAPVRVAGPREAARLLLDLARERQRER
jgi:trehalose 6-phosphate phosphatase